MDKADKTGKTEKVDSPALAEYDDLRTRHMVQCVVVGKNGIFVQLKAQNRHC